MVGEACLPSNAYYPRTPDYTLCSWVHVCWSEHSDSSFVYGFMSLDYGFGTMTATTYLSVCGLSSTFSNIFSETAGRIEVRFHMGPPWDRGTKVCSWGHLKVT